MQVSRDVILWGESQVGKTSALSTYLCTAIPAWLDMDDDTTKKSFRLLERIYQTLQRNRLPEGTVAPQHYTFRHAASGVDLRFRDMRGSDAGEPSEEELKAIDSAAGVIVFVAWPGQSDVQRLTAAQTSLRRALHRKPCALVITKAETHLTRLELAGMMLNDPVTEPRGRELPHDFVDLLRGVPRQRIFFVSAFGYNAEGFPAQFLDEFGRVVPSGIRPVNVQMPFDYVVQEVTCANRP
jgi:hypothetical protein